MLFCHKNQPVAMHLVSIYRPKDFQGTVVTWLIVRSCCLLSVSFHPKNLSRNLKIPKFP